MQLQWDASALAVQQRIQQAGYDCVLVGGAVRDVLRGTVPTDYDLACSAGCGVLLQLFEGARLTGADYGTVTVPLNGRRFEVTPFRTEGSYADGRHPDQVRFGAALEQDLARRDFTVNAMAWDGTRLIDLFDGLADLALGRICTVGDPARRFTEDGLRILRAFRFASVLNFTLEPQTLAAACACKSQLARLSLPRMKAELQALLLGANPGVLEDFWALGGLEALGVFGPSAPSAQENLTEEKLSTLKPLAQVPCSMLLRWWAFLTLTNTDKKKFCQKLAFSQSFYQDLVLLDTWFCAPADQLTLKRRAARSPVPMADIMAAFCALEPAFEENRRIWTQIQQAGEPCKMEELAIDGKALLALGLRGPAIGRCMELLLEAVQAEPALNRRPTLLSLAQALDELAL